MSIIYTIVDFLFSMLMWILLTPGAFYAVWAFYIVFAIFVLIASFKYDIWKIGRAA